MKTDKELIESYFGKEALELLPLNYQHAKIFRPVKEVSDEEKLNYARNYSNEYYKTDYAAVNNFYKTI